MDFNKLQSKHGTKAIFDEDKFIPAKCFALNLILGGQGFPRRRIYEIHGKEGSGKSTLLYEMLQQATNLPEKPLIILFDQEPPVDSKRLVKFGLIKGENFLYCREPSIEHIFAQIENIMKDAGDPPTIIGIDSINATPPNAHLDLKSLVDEPKPGAAAKAWSTMLRTWGSRIYWKDVTLFLTNHVIDRFNVQGWGGKKTTTPGGRALRYYGSIRLEAINKGLIKNNEQVIGQELLLKIVKNKFSPPFAEARLPLYYGNPTLPPGEDFVGTYDPWGCLWFLKDRGKIDVRGSWSSLTLNYSDNPVTLKFSGEAAFAKDIFPVHKEGIYHLMRQAQFSPMMFLPKGMET